jgi:hypothetical protein
VMAQIPGGDWPALSDAEETALGDRYAEEIARNFDPESQVRAMDKEGARPGDPLPDIGDVRDRVHPDGPALCRRGVPGL